MLGTGRRKGRLPNGGVRVGRDSIHACHISDLSLVDVRSQPCLRHVHLSSPALLDGRPGS
jgi:hypothetical protein